MADSNKTTSGAAGAAELEKDLAHQISALRADFAALTETLKACGGVRAEDLKGRARDLSDEALTESLKVVQDLRRQLDGIDARIEGNVRAHPLAWLAGALGLGLLFGLLLSRRD